MGLRKLYYVSAVFVVLSLLVISPGQLLAQIPSGTLRGQVSDPSGAAVPGAGIQAVSSSGQTSSGVAKPDGSYEIRGLAPGKYTVRAQAKGFAVFEQQSVELVAGQGKKFDISLQIAEEKEQVTVSAQTTEVGVAPQENATSLVIKGDDLQVLSDDPDEMQSELEAWRGRRLGPTGARSMWMASRPGSFLPRRIFLKSESTTILSPRNTTGWATAALKSPPAREQAIFTARS